MNRLKVPKREREQVYKLVAARVRKLVEPDLSAQVLGRLCLYWSWFGMVELRKRKIEAHLQAGSVSWRFQADKGSNPTHWSHVWQPDDPLSQIALASGNLPEVHIWLAVRDRQRGDHQLIDFTTGFLPELVNAVYGPNSWEIAAPPKYFWGEAEEVPEGWRYWANNQATTYVYQRIQTLMKDSIQTLMKSNAHEGLNG